MRRKKTESEKKLYENNRLNQSMAIISRLLGAALNIGFAFIMQYVIEAVEFNNIKVLYQGAYIFVAYLVTYIAFGFSNRNFGNKYIKRALSQFKEHIFEKILNNSISQFSDKASAKFISAFSNDLSSIENNYLVGNLVLISSYVHFIGAALSMIILCWYIAIPILLVTGVCILLSLRYGKRLINKENETSEQNMGFVSQVKDLLNGYIVIKSFKAEKEVLKIFKNRNTELEDTKQERRVTSDTVSIFGDISSIVVNTCIFGLGFIFAFKGYLSIGKVMAMVQLGSHILMPVRTIAPVVSNRNAALRLIERLDNEVMIDEETGEYIKIASFESGIEFKNVTFAYDDEKNVLDNISFKIKKGKNYAIVGGSGSGKSTILKLLLGYYKEYQGDIFIDGVQIRDIDLSNLYDLISIIQQEVFLFDSTIYDNITMFKDFDPAKIESTLRRSGLDNVIQEKGKEYMCGEGGKNLSGGEKQRVSIARCLIKETPIVLIDEATAALDNTTAQAVENAILAIDNLTRLVVTHRFNEAILKQYDEILVINMGKIIEVGKFDELMKKKGYFYSLYNVSQAK